MAQSINTFIKSKLNKDLDARLIPNGEYRDANNVQISKSEGSNVGSLENVLGNEEVLDINTLTGTTTKWNCIGQLPSEVNDSVYMFWTDYVDPTPLQPSYDKDANSAIIKYNALTNTGVVLVEGPFLNFSRTHPIYGVNLLEDLLFWTDNRNQPRVINIATAETVGVTHYTTEDQISVAKYNPYEPMYLWQESAGSSATVPYETTMKDVTSYYLPNGGTALADGGVTSATITIDEIQGDLVVAGGDYGTPGVPVSLRNTTAPYTLTDTTETLTSFNGTDTIVLSGSITVLDNQMLVFNPNPYYDGSYAGDEDYLEDKFIRFSYRFKFEDGEYSLMAPFTQEAFIPKQDGYFMWVQDTGVTPKDDQTDTYRSTVVSFMENKVDEIELRIPLPSAGNTLESTLKVLEMDILYKESDGLAVKVIDTIPIADIATTAAATSIYDYTYLSQKPFKTLPSNELIRVYDRVPVKALSQEVSGNRIIYGNFQNKHTPPEAINYNVAASAKSDFDLQTGTATVDGAQDIAAHIDFDIAGWTPFEVGDDIIVGMIVSITSSGAIVGTVSEVTSNSIIQLDTALDLADTIPLTFNPAGPDSQTVSKIEYPNSTLKQNRNYQVGIVLADKFGRQSTVVLSNNTTTTTLGGSSFVGDTIYSAYNNASLETYEWPGNSIKLLFNEVISPSNPNYQTGWPGLYNGDPSGSSYNPLGWYSYKVVVKQTEQEYYNVYLPGIMASYAEDQTLELGSTSFASLINDNINKVPRDLNEVGPDQRQFRSSVQLFGRVENTSTVVSTSTPSTNIGQSNKQYYPGRAADIVSTISTLTDLFSYSDTDQPRPNYYPQFYALESNPLIAKISTRAQIGQISTTNYTVSSGIVDTTQTGSGIALKNVIPTVGPTAGDFVTGPTIPEGIYVNADFASTTPDVDLRDSSGLYSITLQDNDVLQFWPGYSGADLGTLKRPGVQYLAVYETEPVESLLDIYWETTTAGLLSELNNLILNTQNGAGSLSSFNSSALTEGLSSGAVMVTQFTLLNNFGVAVTPGDITSITLASAIDGNGLDRQLVVNGGPYFALVAAVSGDAGYYEIEGTAAYYNSVYYDNEPGLNRVFTFLLNTTTTVSTVVSNNSFTETVSVSNVAPTFSSASPGDGSVVYTNRTITASQGQADFVNGADNTALRYLDTMSVEIPATSGVTNLSTSADVTSSNYFNVTRTQTGTVQRGNLYINNSSMPVDIYRVIMRGTDSGPATVDYTLDIDLRTPINYIKTGNLVCDTGYSYDEYPLVLIYISTSTITAQNGWYIYIGTTTDPFAELTGGTTTITIDRTNAYTSAGGAAGSPGTFLFDATSQAAVEALYETVGGPGDCDDGSYDCCTFSYNSASDLTGYTTECI